MEAVELPGSPDVLGVQWHPEMGGDPSLFHWLADRAQRATARTHASR